jgi:hypothetical protein
VFEAARPVFRGPSLLLYPADGNAIIA